VTRDQVMQLVETTVRDMAADAPGTISNINSRSAPYLDPTNPELYVYVFDNQVLEVANSSNPSMMVGRSFKGVPDMTGKLYDKLVEGTLNNGKGWEDCVFTMPGKIGLYHKSTHYMLATGSDGKQYIVNCGLYVISSDK
jgi:hypothetical protein